MSEGVRERPVIVLRLTVADMLAAARLHHLAGMGSRRTLAFVAVLAVVAFGAGAAIADLGDGWVLIGAAAAVGMVVYLYALFLVVRMVRLPLAVRRAFREQRNLHEDHEIAWSERSYAAVGRTTRSDLPWSDYLKWRENDRVLLLYVSSGFYQVLPKRALSADAVSDIRGHLERAGVKKGPLFLG